MCYAVVERYSVCRCLFYKHPVDMCTLYGKRGHAVKDKEVLVGYACEEHSSDYYGVASKFLPEFAANDAAEFDARERLREGLKEGSERDQRLKKALHRKRGRNSSQGDHETLDTIYPEEQGSHLRSHDKIIPRLKLEALVTVATVIKDIQSSDVTIDYDTALGYAKQVCEGRKPAKRLYAALTLLKREGDIVGLLDEGVCDEDLPLGFKTNGHVEENRGLIEGFKHKKGTLSSNDPETLMQDVQGEKDEETERSIGGYQDVVGQESHGNQPNDIGVSVDAPLDLEEEAEESEETTEKTSNDNKHGSRQPNEPKFQELLAREIEDLDLNVLDDNDTLSVCSEGDFVWSAKGSDVASTSTAPAIEEASAELVSLLVEHPKLKELYAPAIRLHGPVEFRRVLCAVFKSYAKALKSGANKPQELKAGDLVRSYARRVAHACVAFHDPSVPLPDVAFRWEALHRQKLFAEGMVENYLHNLGKKSLSYQGRDRDLADMSDESDTDEVEDPLPNLSKVVAYMTSGPPFEQLQKDVLSLSMQEVGSEPTVLSFEKISHMENLDSKVDATISSENCSPSEPVPEPKLNLSSLSVYKKRLSYWLDIGKRPRLVPGCTRLSWHCDCGAKLFEDYATTDPEKLVRLAYLINRPTQATSYEQPTGSVGTSLRTTSTSTISSSSTLSPQSDTDQPNESTHLCSTFNTTCTLCNKILPRRFLALCVNTGRFHKTLGEIDMTKITRDNETFRQIRSRYLEVRSFRARARRLFLLRPSNIHFVKINIEDTFRADIIESPSIPPHTEVHAKRYDYAPLDLPLPPITSNSFLHYMGNPECESLARTSRWSSCLPKKMDEQLLSQRRSCEPDRVVSGWAIHIDETLNEEALAILVLIILVLSAIVGVVYTVCTGDASSGFAIAGYMATAMGVVITVLYFRWQHG